MARAVWIVAGILLALFLAHIAVGPRAEPEPGARAVEEVAARTALVPPSMRQRREADNVPVADAPSGSMRQHEEPHVAALPTANVEGVCNVLDERGTMHAQESGELRLDLDRGRDLNVEVVLGHWTAEVPGDTQVRAVALTLADRPVRLDGGDDLGRVLLQSPLAGRVHEITGAWVPPAVLVVQDARDGVELADVEVVLQRSWNQVTPHAGDYERDVVLRHAASPIELPRGRDPRLVERTYWIRAPGYAWEPVRLERGVGGQRVVSLGPASELDVELVGERMLATKRVRVRTVPGEALVADGRTDRGGSVSFAGVPSGEYAIRVERGDGLDPQVLAEERVELLPYGRERVTIELEPAVPRRTAEAHRERVSIEGTLDFSSSWGDVEPGLELEHIRSSAKPAGVVLRPETESAARRRLSWRAEEVLPGVYSAVALPFHHALLIRVDAEHRGPFEIVVPDPADVDLVFEDEETHAVVQPSSVAWSAAPYLSFDRPRGWDQATGHFSFRAPAGRVKIMAEVDGCTSFHASDVVPGYNALRILVAAPCGIRLALLDGQKAIRPEELDPDWFWTAISEESNTGITSSDMEGSLQDPGVHQIAFQPIAGFEPIPPQEVILAKGEWKDLVIELRRLYEQPGE